MTNTQHKNIIQVSGKHHSHFSHHSHQHPCSPDPNHLIIDSLHLLQLIKLPFINTHSTHAPHPVYRSLPRTVPDSLMLLTCVYLPFSFPRYSSDPPVRHQTHCSGFPATKETLSILQDVQRTIFSISIHLPFLSSITLSCYSINLLVIHLPVCVWPVS